MKIHFFLIFLALGLSLQAQKNIYESDKFDELSESHQILAIIPFVTRLELKDSISQEQLQQLEENEGYTVQNALETYFSQGKKNKRFTVEFQNIKNTNALLAKNNISYDNIDIYTIKELCTLLNVDGIISGNLSLNVLLSKGVPTEFSFMDYIKGDANYGRIGIKVSDGGTGKLLWKYEKEINKKSGKNTYDLITIMMKQATRKFPYDTERRKKKS
ncbi:hypothetical protein U1E44_07605 [Arenibacter sp. GZD96]|uniref:hypothetical protein n=1 Tax=Aurantibrevibacter litoralis TaxID=3106030 RepID=UPI002AFF43EA|nr:hypothetical protein [Arenibacter sp. GZD-96]MEA1785952.1 hypothetical protein [Arenibacter sp. GZD-96]